MLSYRHAFHAGNHADVLKHAVLIQIINYLCQKDKSFCYIDTHAGAGSYTLNGGFAEKREEYKEGIACLWDKTDLPPLLAHYLAVVRQLNPDRLLKNYPGSPWIAAHLLRKTDSLRLFERHSQDSRLLRKNLAVDKSKRILLHADDGFAGLKSLLPPPSRRALVLIDPSYEEKQDYERVIVALKDALSRFATGTYMLWYPLLQRLEAHELPKRLKRLPCERWLHVALRVMTPAADGFGMFGSGLFILNPPWTLHDQLAESLPCLVEQLGQSRDAGFTLEQNEA